MPIRLPRSLPEGTLLFHSGTAMDNDGTLRVSGGRVFSATGLGPDIRTALQASQTLADSIDFEGKVLRRDIGWRELRRARAS
jgi:phosphoribosylamine--glycine ligase